MADYVEIFEVGPRDGLQNERATIATADKIALIDVLSGAGFRRIEVGSFVSPRWIPQMADTDAVLAGLRREPGVGYAALTPNMKGYRRALDAGVDEIAVFASASEGFSKANLNCSVVESLERFAPVLEAARHIDLPVRGYVSCVTDCPFEGAVSAGQAAQVVEALFTMGCYEVSLGDTLGRATPEAVDALLRAVLQDVPPHRLSGHFHDTAGRALENVEVALGRGLRVFDAATGGLGGCPYAPGAEGNLATEKLADRLAALGYETRLDPARLAEAARMAQAMRSPSAA
ncbi:hydroxymethylglutaryl-CoA lyase [Brevirhabdus sp.]|uniref:hydroxymethylglutaryl-CoA lyase n=1 Tax=Brevirhabdus sp. TaxID=2004514 RepID=UPI0040582754